jgi:predicted peptidase
MKRLIQLLIALTIVDIAPASAQFVDIDGFTARLHSSGMPYRLFIPKGYNKSQKYPLILWLHGSGSMGKDNLKQITGDSRAGTHVWTTPENQAKHPAFVLAPQCAETAELCWDNPQVEEPEDQMLYVMEILETLQAEYSIDADRIYVAGQSMGGYGTWDIIIKRPDLFAAAIPICGGGNSTRAARIANVAVWAFHGSDDQTVSVSESRKMIAAVKRAGGNPKYTEYKGMRHEIWDRVFKEPGLVEWLFAQHK